MKITFTNNISPNDHIVFVTFDKKTFLDSKFLEKKKKIIWVGFLNQKKKNKKNFS